MAESLFTSQTPASANNADGGATGITTATKLRFTVDGTISAIRFFSTTTVTASGENYTGQLWEATAANPNGAAVGGAPLSTQTIDSSLVVTGTWNTIVLPSPISVLAGRIYVPSVNNAHNQGRYVSSNGFWGSGLTNGHIVGIQDGATVAGYTGIITNGVFAAGAGPGVYPTNTFGSTCYFIDVVFTPTSTARTSDFMPFFL